MKAVQVHRYEVFPAVVRQDRPNKGCDIGGIHDFEHGVFTGQIVHARFPDERVVNDGLFVGGAFSGGVFCGRCGFRSVHGPL